MDGQVTPTRASPSVMPMWASRPACPSPGVCLSPPQLSPVRIGSTLPGVAAAVAVGGAPPSPVATSPRSALISWQPTRHGPTAVPALRSAGTLRSAGSLPRLDSPQRPTTPPAACRGTSCADALAGPCVIDFARSHQSQHYNRSSTPDRGLRSVEELLAHALGSSPGDGGGDAEGQSRVAAAMMDISSRVRALESHTASLIDLVERQRVWVDGVNQKLQRHVESIKIGNGQALDALLVKEAGLSAAVETLEQRLKSWEKSEQSPLPSASAGGEPKLEGTQCSCEQIYSEQFAQLEGRMDALALRIQQDLEQVSMKLREECGRSLHDSEEVFTARMREVEAQMAGYSSFVKGFEYSHTMAINQLEDLMASLQPMLRLEKRLKQLVKAFVDLEEDGTGTSSKSLARLIQQGMPPQQVAEGAEVEQVESSITKVEEGS